jgi:hypothetical protein
MIESFNKEVRFLLRGKLSPSAMSLLKDRLDVWADTVSACAILRRPSSLCE